MATPPSSAAPSIDQKRVDTIIVLEKVLTSVLAPGNTVTPDQLKNLMEMFVSLMFMRNVKPEFWSENLSLGVRGVALAQSIQSEFAFLGTEGLPEEARKAMQVAIDLSLKEINEVRGKMVSLLGLIRQCPMPGASIH